MKIAMKFGGTSVGSIAALKQVVDIIEQTRQNGHEMVVVVSAMSGVTDLLINAAQQAEAGDESVAQQARQTIETKHEAVILNFLGQTVIQETILAEIQVLLNEFETLCHGIHVLGELTPRALDVISGLGERMSVRQIAAILTQRGLTAEAVEATEVIVTTNHHGGATPLLEETAQKMQATLNPMLMQDKIPIVTGYIGATVEGTQTTLGRGGSDYSATIIGRALEADEVWIWTDVNGVLTTDPRIVADAQTIPKLSYAEMNELACFGAKVLHPRAVRPTRQANIPLRILNTFKPNHSGTLIQVEADQADHPVKGITVIHHLSLINVTGTGMIGIPGVAGRTFMAVAQTDTNVLMISQSSSEQSICFVINTVDVSQVIAALEKELAPELERRDLDRILVHDGMAIMAVVGAGMKGMPGVSGKVFSALGGANINIIAIAQGSSEYNISLVLADADANTAVRLVHHAFELGVSDQPKALGMEIAGG